MFPLNSVNSDNRPFLKSTPFPCLSLHDFYIGSTINLLGRLIHIIGYGDEATCNAFKGIVERCVLLCPVQDQQKLVDIIKSVEENKYRIINLKIVHLSPQLAKEFLEKFSTCTENENIIGLLSKSKTMCIEIIGPNCSAQMQLLYQHSVSDAMIFASKEQDGFLEQSSYLFNCNRCPNTAMFRDSALLIVKPHILKEGKLSGIICRLLREGYEISAATMLLMSRTNADEFLEVYKGVLSDYGDISNELCNGKLVAFEVTRRCLRDSNNNTTQSVHGDCIDPNTVAIQQNLRSLCGPFDPVCAKKLFPNSIRAHFGKCVTQNAVHCTDLPEDVHLELEYFFRILQK